VTHAFIGYVAVAEVIKYLGMHWGDSYQ